MVVFGALGGGGFLGVDEMNARIVTRVETKGGGGRAWMGMGKTMLARSIIKTEGV